jgi:DNA adenine methylase
MGSKNRIVKNIIPIILKHRKTDQWFVDLFCGGCSVVQNVDGKRIANDKNKYLIAMWQGLQQDRIRPHIISKELYSKARTEYNNGTNIEFDDFMIGWIGWMGSYNGRFFDGGYSGHNVGSTQRNYIDEQIRNTELQIKQLMDVKFFSKDYSEFDFKEPCLIYCDIPYKDTKQYATSKDFDYDKFFEWCRVMSKNGHTVFISEYQAPSDFLCVWEKELTNSMNQTKTYKPIERLFIAPLQKNDQQTT